MDNQYFFFYLELEQLRHRHFIEPQTLPLKKNQSISLQEKKRHLNPVTR